jgi:hypothetical protein
MLGEHLDKAVIDRFEGSVAVLLVGDDRRRIDVARSVLPRGAREGSWLRVSVGRSEVFSAFLDKDETEAARKRITDKLGRLRRGAHLKGDTARPQ